MSVRTARTATIAKWSVVPVALALSGAVVAHSSYAAFSSTTSNPTNNWAAGSVSLTNDGSATAAFTVTNLKPGSTGTKVIVVSSTGSLASTVKLYGTAYTSTNTLGDNIDLSITSGTGGSFTTGTGFTAAGQPGDVFGGTLAEFSAKSTYANATGSWVTTGVASGAPAETKSYQITYTVKSGATNAVQGGTAAIGFTWEAQNN